MGPVRAGNTEHARGSRGAAEDRIGGTLSIWRMRGIWPLACDPRDTPHVPFFIHEQQNPDPYRRNSS